MAITLVVEWQRTWNKKKKLTSAFAQDYREVKNIETDLIEVIKYGSKIFTDPDMKKGKNKTVPPIIYAAAMDNIFMAMEDHRLFDRFGFNLPQNPTPKKTKTTFLQEFEDIIFDRLANDWVNYDTGELLTGYTPTPQLEFLLNNHINTETT